MKIKRMVASYMPNSLIYGKEYSETLNFLLESEKFTKEEIKKWQLNKLNEILKYSNENILYYKELFKENNIILPLKNLEEIKKIPFLTKKIIRKNYTKLINSKIKGKEYNTGGSTGNPLKLFKSRVNSKKEQAFLDYYMKKLGLKTFRTKKAIIRGDIPKKEKIYEKVGNELILSSYLLSEKTLNDYIRILEKFNPEIIHVYPSSIYSLAKLIEKNKIKLKIPNLKLIFSSSETFNIRQKELVERIFRCRVFDLYGNTENSVHATNLYPEKSYKFNDFYSYVEIDNNEIISTSFNDLGMPLIRYKTEDEIEYIDKENFIIKGRTQDYIYGRNTEKYPVVGIIFGQHFSAFKSMGNFQILQNEYGKIDIIIEGEKNLTLDNEKEIIRILKNVSNNNLEVEIKYVKNIERTQRGKYKFLIQNIGKEEK
ncbi:MAG: hypothetical protein MR673_06960 [Fusobacterium perfoetens]|uniref:hypothetical protein n=1 Tax=Fusobacterium perfoetens TaxID=852 RepID=UPI0023F40EC7|nr:hypothetical protein [Fusobacterium perfoetens]MCI6152849.1 hypothetical protein [Fusobacterium perfoetens]MDY3237259.1 hypothetical protein [Fusobacterium perfoetens]